MTNAITNLQTINQSNDFIANAKKALRADMVNSRKLTLDSITAVTALSFSLFIHNNPESDYSIYKPNSTEISESRLRKQLVNAIFNKQQLAELQTSEGRVIYNKVKAGMIVFFKEFNQLGKLWQEATDTSDYISKVYTVVEGYGSLSKILKLGKKESIRNSESSNAESDSESDNTTDSTDMPTTSNKSVYNKVSTDLTHILNLIEKTDNLDNDLIQLLNAGIQKIVKTVQEKTKSNSESESVAAE